MDIFEILDVLRSFIIGGDGTVPALNGFIDELVKYCLILASVIMVILVGSKVITYFLNPSGNMDPYVLVKPILILVALTLYRPLVELLIVDPVNLITSLVESASLKATNTPNIDSFSNAVQQGITAVADGDDDGELSIYDFLQVSAGLEFIHLLIQVVALLIIGFISMKQLVLEAIYFVLGVLVLPLSLIPSNFDILKKWFFGFIGVLLWLPILRIFQTIIVLIHNAPVDGFAQPLFAVALQIIMIYFIWNVPTYANFLVSSAGESGGSIFSTAYSMYQFKEARDQKKEARKDRQEAYKQRNKS